MTHHEAILEKHNQYIFKENSNSSIPIELELPEKWIFKEPIMHLQAAYETAFQQSTEIEHLAKKAFFEQDKFTWDLIQKLLYAWNIDDILRKDVFHGYRFIVQCILRNKIIEIENRARTPVMLACKNDFTPDKAVQELADKASSHRITKHPLLQALDQDGLSVDHIKIFLNNYYVNNRFFHLFITTLALFTPLERRVELANNFYDELGSGDGAMAHPLLFLKNFDGIGKPNKIIPFPETLYLLNSKLFAAFLSGNYHYGVGGFGFIELTMPDQMQKILNGLKKSNLPKKNLIFWETHIVIDVEHGKNWFKEMKALITSPEEATQCLQGGLHLLEARAKMYDGIWNGIIGNKA